jgi:hypothetical protein
MFDKQWTKLHLQTCPVANYTHNEREEWHQPTVRCGDVTSGCSCDVGVSSPTLLLMFTSCTILVIRGWRNSVAKITDAPALPCFQNQVSLPGRLSTRAVFWMRFPLRCRNVTIIANFDCCQRSLLHGVTQTLMPCVHVYFWLIYDAFRCRNYNAWYRMINDQ